MFMGTLSSGIHGRAEEAGYATPLAGEELRTFCRKTATPRWRTLLISRARSEEFAALLYPSVHA